jgi:hypothetical protein
MRITRFLEICSRKKHFSLPATGLVSAEKHFSQEQKLIFERVILLNMKGVFLFVEVA